MGITGFFGGYIVKALLFFFLNIWSGLAIAFPAPPVNSTWNDSPDPQTPTCLKIAKGTFGIDPPIRPTPLPSTIPISHGYCEASAVVKRKITTHIGNAKLPDGEILVCPNDKFIDERTGDILCQQQAATAEKDKQQKLQDGAAVVRIKALEDRVKILEEKLGKLTFGQ